MNVQNIREAHVVVLMLPLLVLGIILWRAYHAITGPLAKLPGPYISKWTNLRLKVAVVTGERARYVHSLHERYGPIVRISPDEVAVADIDASKVIYKMGSGYIKSRWYSLFVGEVAADVGSNLFSMRDLRQHGEHRKLLAHNFSEKAIHGMEPYIRSNVEEAIARMKEDTNRQGYANIFFWYMCMATDVIGEASFGESFQLLRTGKKNQYMRDLEKVGQYGIYRSEFHTLFDILSRVPFGPGKEVNGAVMRLVNNANESIQRYWRQLRADPDNIKPTLLTKEYAALENGTITQKQLIRDAMGNIIAGTDTTAIAATYAVWLLSQHRDIEQELIQAVSTLPEGFDDEDLKNVPQLQNVINETLRLRGSVTESLPRLVPAGGATFCGYHVPGGSTIGIQAYTMHRLDSVWPDPETFNPSRWNDPTKAMRDSFLPWGGGSRVCLGSHFAQLELRYALANFYRMFEGGVKPCYVENFSDAEMTPMSYFLMPPRGKRCLVEPRKS